jgi:prepilin-type N-terminal cleavage/methylation domain-containing protein
LADVQRVRFATLRSEAGFSLAEIVITIAIVGITFTALLGGMLTAIKVSTQYQRNATADAVARSAAEWVKDPAQTPYVNCAGNTAYGLSGVTVPSGYNVAMVVRYWNGAIPTGAAYQPVFQASCSTDAGVQQITITATTSDGTTESVQVLKRATT